MYDVLLPVLQQPLNTSGFSLVNTFFHSHFPEGRIGGNVLVLCKRL